MLQVQHLHFDPDLIIFFQFHKNVGSDLGCRLQELFVDLLLHSAVQMISSRYILRSLILLDSFLLFLLSQCASTEITCESGAAMAASLANGGLCPLSGDQVLSPAATRSMLSMMQVAGMKDYSTTFHYKVQPVSCCSKSV